MIALGGGAPPVVDKGAEASVTKDEERLTLILRRGFEGAGGPPPREGADIIATRSLCGMPRGDECSITNGDAVIVVERREAHSL